ncbi:MAG TPA: hypothetical protein VLZ04_01025, partial [Gaiellaceae bacterium]|nr:hypothetical protein [Gaiellaceae bacterium]
AAPSWIQEPGRSSWLIVARVLDPGLAAFLLAFAFAGLLALPGLRKTARRAEQRFCETCGRLKILGERTCDCD